jgi:FkbH-like protein
MSPTLAISATFTAEPLLDPLAFCLREAGLNFEPRFAPINQVFQQLLDPASLLAANSGGVNVLLIRLEDWAADLEHHTGRLASELERLARFPSPTLVFLCPDSPGFHAPQAEAALAERAAGLSSVYLIPRQEIETLYPVPDYYDPHAFELAHIPYTPEMFAALALLIARKIHALRGTPFKVIALDCDETLWTGVCAEDGPSGVILDPYHRRLQEFMLAQQQRGMLLCLVSKNIEEDVREVFRCNPSMPLRWEHFVSTRINWQPKSENLRSLAEELDLGLDSFIFVDDNPAETAQVRAECPEVLCLTLPDDVAQIPAFLNQQWAFDRLQVTAEDRQRTALYAERVERSRLERQSASLAEFLAALQLQIEIQPLQEPDLPRVSQLTFRTNQMNFSTRRRTETEIRGLLASPACQCLTVRLRDRFGDYGLVGVIITRAGQQALTLDTFLLSCRALGKGVEHRMMAEVGRRALDQGFQTVLVPFVDAGRNLPAKTFLESLGQCRPAAAEGGVLYQFQAADLAVLEFRPSQAPPRTSPQPVPSAKTAPEQRFLDLPPALASPKSVLQALRAAQRLQTPHAASAARPRTELEAQLAALWADLLNRSEVGIHDNFFDLGGHSLLAVQLLSAVRQAYDVELTLDVIYSGDFTVAELAKAVELAQIREAGESEYAALLQELDGLSDEEVKALLEAEQGGEQRPQ